MADLPQPPAVRPGPALEAGGPTRPPALEAGGPTRPPALEAGGAQGPAVRSGTRTPAVRSGTRTPALEARGLTLHYRVAGRGQTRRPKRVVHAVDGVDIDLWPSEVTAVVGESGSGKSSLARMLCRLTTPTGGRLWLAGSEVPLSARRSRAYRRHVQLILQDPFASLNPVHTVRYQLRRPLQLHGTAGPGGVDDTVEALLEKVKVTPPSRFLDRFPHELSGGQLQRIAIARCLAVNPQVLLADEPVSMLDVSIRLGVLNLLEELCQQDRLALLYITHDIASARYLATTVMVMYAGQVVESGPALQVVDQPSHPYTQLLLSASADPDRSSPVRLTTTGAPPSLIDPPRGCRFHPRCPHAMPVCSVEAPPAVEVTPGQRAACWLHVDPPPKLSQTPPEPDSGHASFVSRISNPTTGGS